MLGLCYTIESFKEDKISFVRVKNSNMLFYFILISSGLLGFKPLDPKEVTMSELQFIFFK
jgi:hypothetical protein